MQEGLHALPYGQWIELSLWGGIVDPSVDVLIYEDHVPGLWATTKVWGAYRQAGPRSLRGSCRPPRRSDFRAIEVASAKAPPADIVISAGEMVASESRPALQPQQPPPQAQAAVQNAIPVVNAHGHPARGRHGGAGVG